MASEPLSGDAKHTLQHLMSNIDFVAEDGVLKRYQCRCCQRVALLHHIAECGHIFCDKCLYKILSRSCPVQQCGNGNIEKLTHDEALEAEVRQLEIYCHFRKHGCEETFPLEKYFEHQQACHYITDGLLSSNWQKLKDLLPQKSVVEMEGKVLRLDDELKDVCSRLDSLEENIGIIKENEKNYNQAFIVLKEIEKMLREQGFKPNDNLEGPNQTSVNERQVEDDATGKLTSGKGAGDELVKVDDILEVKSFINQMQERFSSVEKDVISLKSKDGEIDVSEGQREALLTERIGLMKDELEKMQKSHWEKQKHELESKLRELGCKNEDIMLAIKKLREVDKIAAPPQASLVAETEFKRYEEDVARLNDAVRELQETVAVIKHRETMAEEHRQTRSVETEEKFQEVCEVEENGRENSEGAVSRLETRLQQVEKVNEKLLCELKQIKNRTEGPEKAFVSSASEEVKTSRCVSNLEGVSCSRSGATGFIWPLTGFSDILSRFQNNVLQEIESDIFLVQGPQRCYEMRTRLMLYKDFLSIYMAFVPGEDGSSNNSVFFHRRTFVVMDQGTVISGRRDLVRSWEPSFGSKNTEKWMKEFWGALHFVPLALLQDGDRYVKNDTVLIKIVIEPLAALYKAFAANDGVLFWKVDGYSWHKKREANGHSQGLKSEYFYSSQRGYRLQMELCLNGYGVENKEHLSAFIWFRRGPFDDFLPKRFSHRTTIWILDQTDAEEKIHLKKVVQLDKIRNTVYSKLALQAAVEDPRYLKNDALLVKAIVEPWEDKEISENERS